MTEPRGIRNNNPGNIRLGGATWRGELRLKPDDPRYDPSFCVFDTPENGIRALAITLRTYYFRHKLRKVATIISRWAPSNENDTNDYAIDVAKQMNVNCYAQLNFEPITWSHLIEAIIQHENGKQPYPPEMILHVCESIMIGAR